MLAGVTRFSPRQSWEDSTRPCSTNLTIPWLPSIICQRVCSTMLITSALTCIKAKSKLSSLLMMHMPSALQMTYPAMHTARSSMEHSWIFTVVTSVRETVVLKSPSLIYLDRELYKTRLEVFFRHYPSKNFDGRPWADLSEIILVSHIWSLRGYR
jgi:hypothetical protein